MMTKAKKHTHTHTHTEDTIKQRSLHILFASVSLHYFNKKNDRPVELSQYLIWALEHFILPIKVYICRHIFTCIQGKIDNLKSRTADFLKNCSNWEGNSSCALNYHLALSSWVVSSATIRYYRLRLCWTDESAHLSTRTDSEPLEPPHEPIWALVHFLKVKMTSNIFRQLTSWKKLSWGGQQHHHLIVKPDSRCLASLVAWRTGRECLMPYQLVGFGSVCSISTIFLLLHMIKTGRLKKQKGLGFTGALRGAPALYPRRSFWSFGEKNFSVFYFSIFYLGLFFKLIHEPLRLEEGTLAEDDSLSGSGLPCPWQKGGGETSAIGRVRQAP